MRRPSFTIALTVLVSAAASAQGGLDPLSAPGLLLARAADADRSGDLTADERAAFLARVPQAADGAAPRGEVVGLALTTLLDLDGDGTFARADLERLGAALDADGDGDVTPAELAAARAGGLRASLGEWLLGGIAGAAVGDGDWAAWLAARPAGAVPGADLGAWIEAAERDVPADREAFTPAIGLATFRATLDADRDGRLTTVDLSAHVAALDLDGDGAVSAAEMQPATPTAAVRAGWEVSDDVAARAPGMPWQRTLEDALAVSRSTGKPLLVCVNMDGEAASDTLAGGRYRDPRFLALVDGFVPVLASPDRHTERDHDDLGARMPCPRFGTLVEAEHVGSEPELFRRYFHDLRIAPRHVAVAPDGRILFDLHLIQDLTLIDQALEEHGVFGVVVPDPGARALTDLLDDPDARAREALEGRFRAGDEALRCGLAALALDERRATQHPELVRLALRDPSPAVRRVVLADLCRNATRIPLDLAPEAFALADRAEGARLAEALAQRAQSATGDDERVRARRLARLFAAVSADDPPTLDTALWRAALAAAPGAVPAAPPSERARMQALEWLEARLDEAPEDARLHALRASVLMAEAQARIAAGTGNPGFLLEDARAAATTALGLDPTSRAAAVALARAAWALSDFEAAGDAAVRALDALVDEASGPVAAELLDVLARARTRSLYAALGEAPAWPARWAREALAAVDVLLEHPALTEAQALSALELCGNLELHADQRRLASRAVQRFPGSPAVHEWFRFVVLRDVGAEGLVEAYDTASSTATDAAAVRAWFAGYGKWIAAERMAREGRPERAIDTYRAAEADLSEALDLEPGYAASTRPTLAQCALGRARLALAAGKLDDAFAALRECSDVDPEAVSRPDAAGRTALDDARALVEALLEAGRGDEAERVREWAAAR